MESSSCSPQSVASHPRCHGPHHPTHFWPRWHLDHPQTSETKQAYPHVLRPLLPLQLMAVLSLPQNPSEHLQTLQKPPTPHPWLCPLHHWWGWQVLHGPGRTHSPGPAQTSGQQELLHSWWPLWCWSTGSMTPKLATIHHVSCQA